MKHYTYFHTRNDTGMVFYVGKGQNNRAHDLGRNPHWNHVASKCGHTVHIAAKWETEKEAFEHEKFLILCFKGLGHKLTNMTEGGDGGNTTGGRNWMHCGEERKMVLPADVSVHLSLGWKAGSGVVGRKDIGNLTRGIAKTQEIKDKISNTLTGRTLPDAHRVAIAKGQTGLKRTAEGRKNISEALKGKVRSPDHCKNLSIAKQGKMIVNKGGIDRRVSAGELQSFIALGWQHGLAKASCPHCGVVGSKGHLKRWHFDNCKGI